LGSTGPSAAEPGNIRAVEAAGCSGTRGIWRPCRAESGGEYHADPSSPSEHRRAGKVVALMGAGKGAGDGVTGRCTECDALGVRGVTEALDVTIKLVGIPAEESGGGKVQLVQRGYAATW
jgi:hypothetical protein